MSKAKLQNFQKIIENVDNFGIHFLEIPTKNKQTNKNHTTHERN